MFHGHETHCFMALKHLESGAIATDIVTAMLIANLIKLFSVIDFWLMVFHAVSRCFTALFHAVSKYFMLFHGVSLLCFMLFHAVSLLCLMLF